MWYVYNVYIHLCDLNWFHVEWNLISYMFFWISTDIHHFMIFHDPWLGICGHGHGHGLHTARHFSEGSHPQNHRREPRHALEQMEYDIRQAHHIGIILGIPQKKWWQGETCWSDFLFHVNFERFLAKQTDFWVCRDHRYCGDEFSDQAAWFWRSGWPVNPINPHPQSVWFGMKRSVLSGRCEIVHWVWWTLLRWEKSRHIIPTLHAISRKSTCKSGGCKLTSHKENTIYSFIKVWSQHWENDQREKQL